MGFPVVTTLCSESVVWTRHYRGVAYARRKGAPSLGQWACCLPLLQADPSSEPPVLAPSAFRVADLAHLLARHQRYCVCASSWSSTSESFESHRLAGTPGRTNRSSELRTTCTRTTAPHLVTNTNRWHCCILWTGKDGGKTELRDSVSWLRTSVTVLMTSVC